MTTFRRLARSGMGIAALVSVLLVAAFAIVSPMIWGDAAARYDTDAISRPASGAHLAGTDAGGRDIFLRVLVATRLSVGLSVAATVIAVVVGVAIGSVPAITGPRVGRFVAAVVSTAIAFPAVLLAIFVATVVGVGATGAVLALGIAGAPWFARLTQTLAASVAARDYIAAARVLGVGRLRLLARHIWPNIAEPLAVNATIAAGANLLAFAGLSYLGLGVQSPSYDWGRLLNEGVNSVYTNPAAAVAPGLAIVVAGLALNLGGELAAQVLGGRAPRARTARRERPGGEVADTDALLRVQGLSVRFPLEDGRTHEAVREVDLTVAPGEAVGIVGESGSGKSLTALAVAQLLAEPADVRADAITFDGAELTGLSGRRLRARLGDSMAFVFQDPMSSLNPVMRVGRQLAEVAVVHAGADRASAMRQAVERLRAVRIPAAERRARQLPHEFSGGMRQRAMIAMGLMGDAKLLIADEPTTALDVTVQRDVLRLVGEARARSGAALLLISHDIAVVGSMCERIVVMYAGRVVEEVAAASIREDARHPYTRGLLASLPTMTTARDEPLATVPGRPPAPGAVPDGCAFAPRCAFADERCRTAEPPLVATPSGRAACFHPQAPDHRAVRTVSTEKVAP
ncbi:dipeptide/oligopeptide/nickel ABC transporter permease/ATP-binding protein [Jatrophihabitans fulvus]